MIVRVRQAHARRKIELTQMGYAVTGFFAVQRDSALRVVNVDCVILREEEVERLRAPGRHAPGQADRP